ncbi:hypothetical protein FRC03_003998 [Tulasnella sp. 419]|nr:hypothetical protein FRC03_003998 [Tulasnella sp. 419]
MSRNIAQLDILNLTALPEKPSAIVAQQSVRKSTLLTPNDHRPTQTSTSPALADPLAQFLAITQTNHHRLAQSFQDRRVRCKIPSHISLSTTGRSINANHFHFGILEQSTSVPLKGILLMIYRRTGRNRPSKFAKYKPPTASTTHPAQSLLNRPN